MTRAQNSSVTAGPGPNISSSKSSSSSVSSSATEEDVAFTPRSSTFDFECRLNGVSSPPEATPSSDWSDDSSDSTTSSDASKDIVLNLRSLTLHYEAPGNNGSGSQKGLKPGSQVSTSRPSTPESRPQSQSNKPVPVTPGKQIPSFSLTPPETRPRHGQEDVGVESLNAQLDNLAVSPGKSSEQQIDMSSISQALREIPASPSPSPSPSPSRNLQPTATSPSPRSRRSSSRVSLAPHDVTDETPPNDRFDQPALQKALRDTENLMSDLAVVLRSGSIQYEPDSVMKRLSKRADELVKFQCPPTRIVGFVGDSGAGKSSLLNSLLDYRGLARTSNIGGACTCVVTEYHHHPSSLFAIDVERFSGSEIKDQVLNLLRDLRHFHLNRSTLDSDEVRDLQDRADLARDTFKSMFRGTFTEEAFLLSGSETMVYDKLKTWVRELQQQQQEEEEVQTGLKENMSFEECARLILQLTSEETESDGPALWPWIKRIKVYLNAHVLSKGLVLVDLPGLRDLNAARRSVTERYLLQCDEIFVVANIGRAITDVSVSDVIERAKKARLANVGIICTKSDDISADEALTDWKGQRAKEVRRKRDGIRKHERVITEIEEELSQFDEEDEDDLFEDERDEIVRLNSKLRTARKQRDELVFDLQKYLIENRNTLIEKKLVDHYQAQVPAPSPAHHNPNPLRVFCASNTLYWHQREHPRDKAMRYLSLSGIISIRAHCMEMVSESQYVASKKYMKDDVGVLLGELDLWVQSGQGSLSAERKDAVRKTLDTLERNLSTVRNQQHFL